MRILLVNPPDPGGKRSIKLFGFGSIPIGLGYLAAVLREAGHEVSVLDCFALDLKEEDVVREVERADPDVVGVYCVASNLYYAERIARAVRESCDAKLIAGGTHATFLPEDVLSRGFDIVVRGEGEITVRELLERDLDPRGVLGVSYKEDGRVIHNPSRPPIEDLDSLPFPARDLFPMDRYALWGRIRFITLISSRGCPHGCKFCAASAMYPRWRKRTPENVVDEIEFECSRFKTKYVGFHEDNFAHDLQRVEAICNEIIERGLEITWGAAMRIDDIDERIVSKMSESGCGLLMFGIESGEENILKAYKRGIDLDRAREVFSLLRDYGIRSLSTVMIGFPDDSERTVRKTIEFVKRSGTDYALFFYLTPFPGTKLYDEVEREGLIEERDLRKYNLLDPVMRTRYLGMDDLRRLFVEAYRSFYLDPVLTARRFLRELRSLDAGSFAYFILWYLSNIRTYTLGP